MKELRIVLGITVAALALCAGVEILVGGVGLFDARVFVSFVFVPITYLWLQQRSRAAGNDPDAPPQSMRIGAWTWLAGGVGAAVGGLVAFAVAELTGRGSAPLGTDLLWRAIAGLVYGFAFAAIAIIVGNLRARAEN